MVFSKEFLVLFCVSLVISSIGWRNFTHFISVGYGFAVAGCSVAIIAMRSDCLQPSSFMLCFLLILYGLRLTFFLIFRRFKSVTYKRILPELKETGHPFYVKLAVWLGVSLVYVMQVSPVFFRLDNVAHILPVDFTWASLGCLIMAGGLALETLADIQKYRAKNENPDRYCDEGFYKIVRCPNYLGEIIFWTGCFLSGIGSNRTVGQWFVCILGYLCTLYIILAAVRKLEIRQKANYGENPDYLSYVEKTPVVFPFVPFYHLSPLSFLKW